MSESPCIAERPVRYHAHAAEELLPLVYHELRRMAAKQLANELPGQTLQPTALVHEAYLRVADAEHSPIWDGRGHFVAAMAQAMRRILVDRARRMASRKHGCGLRRTNALDVPNDDVDTQIVQLEEVLARFESVNFLAARVVELHHFGGLSHEQVAQTLGITVYQARQKWRYARAWLCDALNR